MFTTALIASDLSPAADRLIDCLCAWRTAGLRKVVVAHVHNVRTTGGLVERIRREHEPRLAAQASRIENAGVRAQWRLEFGVPYVDLDRIAEQEETEVSRATRALETCPGSFDAVPDCR